MQPYFFPYIGYFQLINAVDTFIIYDDVQWINRGWINRNRVLNEGKEYYITLPIQKAPSNQKINERIISTEYRLKKKKIIKQLQREYNKAPFFEETITLVEASLSFPNNNVSQFVSNSISIICSYLNISTPIRFSSELNIPNEIKGQERILMLNDKVGSTTYINPIGGTALYDKEAFKRKNILLQFMQTENITYKQFNKNFLPNLSIIDVLMFNSPKTSASYLKKFQLT